MPEYAKTFTNEEYINALKHSLKELTIDFFQNKQYILSYLMRRTTLTKYAVPIEGTPKQSNSYQIPYIDLYKDRTLFFTRVCENNEPLKTKLKIVFELLCGTSIDEWGKDFDESFRSTSNLIDTYISGFILFCINCRIAQYPIGKMDLSVIKFYEDDFNCCFNDFISFTNKNKLTISLRFVINARLELTQNIEYKNVTIRKASIIDQIEFNAIYGDINNHAGTINHKATVLEYTSKIQRSAKAYRDFFNFEIRNIDNKISRLLVLCSNGNISIISPMLGISACEMFFFTSGRKYSDTYNFNLENQNYFITRIDSLFENNFLKVYDALFEYSLDKTNDFRIEKAFYRFAKAKSAKQLDDKVIELMTGMEYLINTEPYEVTLQLKYYIGKLYNNDYNSQQRMDIIKVLGEFYNLRSSIVHGKKEISSSKKNIALIDKVEKIFIDVFFKIVTIVLKYNYTLNQIHESLKICLFSDGNLYDIMKEKNLSKELLNIEKVPSLFPIAPL